MSFTSHVVTIKQEIAESHHLWWTLSSFLFTSLILALHPVQFY